MPDQILIDQCAPTLAGLKTGNMFPVKIEPGQDICAELRSLNRLRTIKERCCICTGRIIWRGILDIPRHGGSWRRKDIAAAVRENALPS